MLQRFRNSGEGTHNKSVLFVLGPHMARLAYGFMSYGLSRNNICRCSINEKKLKNHNVCLFRENERQEMATSSQSLEVLKMSSGL